VENRNTGYSGYRRLKNGLADLGKEGVRFGGRLWEPYTREQIVANINFGRMAAAMFDLDPDYILTHQCIWATKQDTGPVYPIHKVRNNIYTDTPLNELEWLAAFDMAPDTNEDDDTWWEVVNEYRDADFEPWVTPTKEVIAKELDLNWLAAQYYKIGFNSGPEYPGDEKTRMFTRWFQRSSHAYKHHDGFSNSWAIKADGSPGPATKEFTERRLGQLRLAA
jgi:hypothetical protein